VVELHPHVTRCYCGGTIAHVRRALLTTLSILVLTAVSGCAYGTARYARFLASTSATVDGRLHSNLSGPAGVKVDFYYEYGKTTAYGTQFGHGTTTINAPGSDYEIATKLTGLEPGTTYHYRLCATDQNNNRSPGCVGDRAFTTPTTTGPYITVVPYCLAPFGPVEGIDVTGTGFPPSSETTPVYIGTEVSRDGGPFAPGSSTIANSAGEITLGGASFPRGQIHVYDVRAFRDPNFNGTLDPGEQLLATAHYADHC
jgi:hypothetical protein